jgi:nucleoid-associated protein YgaU
MPVDPTSRFADLPLFDVPSPDGTHRRVVGLRLPRPRPTTSVGRHVLHEGEGLDLLAREFYGDEALWWRLLDANPLVHPFDLKAGDVLEVASAGDATQATRARTF